MLHLYFSIGIIAGLINALGICILRLRGIGSDGIAILGFIVDVGGLIVLWPVLIPFKIICVIKTAKKLKNK